LETGDVLLATQTQGQNFFLAVDANGYEWYSIQDAETGSFTAVLLNYDAGYDPSAWDGLSANYEVNESKWSMVWDPNDGTWTTFAPGEVPSAILDVMAEGTCYGFGEESWNVLVLPATGSLPTFAASAPSNGGATTTIRTAPNGVTTITIETATTTVITVIGLDGSTTTTITPKVQNPPVRPPVERAPRPRPSEPGPTIPLVPTLPNVGGDIPLVPVLPTVPLTPNVPPPPPHVLPPGN